MKLLNRTFHRFNRSIQRSSTTAQLRWWDIAILSAVFFGGPIVTSTQTFLASFRTPSVPDTTATTGAAGLEHLDASGFDAGGFDAGTNIAALGQQALLLAVALIYLYLRKFRFSSIRIQPSIKGTAGGALLFLVAGLLFDLSYYLKDWLLGASTGLELAPEEVSDAAGASASMVDPSLVIYGLFNGFYEEFFFLGLCLAVAPQWRKWAFAYSLLLRCSFHTYQGLFVAAYIGIGIGALYYFVWKKTPSKNLYPIIISHALADIFGASLLGLLG